MCETNIAAMFTMLPLFTLTTARSLCFAPSKVQPEAFLEECKGGQAVVTGARQDILMEKSLGTCSTSFLWAPRQPEIRVWNKVRYHSALYINLN